MSKFKVGDRVRKADGSKFSAWSNGIEAAESTVSRITLKGYPQVALNGFAYYEHELELIPAEAELTPEPETYAVGDTVVLTRTGTVVRLAAQSVYTGEVITPGPSSVAVAGAVMTFSRADIEKKYDAVAEATKVWKDAREAHEAAEMEADRLGKIRDAAYMALANANNNR